MLEEFVLWAELLVVGAGELSVGFVQLIGHLLDFDAELKLAE